MDSSQTTTRVGESRWQFVGSAIGVLAALAGVGGVVYAVKRRVNVEGIVQRNRCGPVRRGFLVPLSIAARGEGPLRETWRSAAIHQPRCRARRRACDNETIAKRSSSTSAPAVRRSGSASESFGLALSHCRHAKSSHASHSSHVSSSRRVVLRIHAPEYKPPDGHASDYTPPEITRPRLQARNTRRTPTPIRRDLPPETYVPKTFTRPRPHKLKRPGFGQRSGGAVGGAACGGSGCRRVLVVRRARHFRRDSNFH